MSRTSDRRPLGQSITARLFDRGEGRARIGPSSRFFHRMGVESPFELDTGARARTRAVSSPVEFTWLAGLDDAELDVAPAEEIHAPKRKASPTAAAGRKRRPARSRILRRAVAERRSARAGERIVAGPVAARAEPRPRIDTRLDTRFDPGPEIPVVAPSGARRTEARAQTATPKARKAARRPTVAPEPIFATDADRITEDAPTDAGRGRVAARSTSSTARRSPSPSAPSRAARRSRPMTGALSRSTVSPASRAAVAAVLDAVGGPSRARVTRILDDLGEAPTSAGIASAKRALRDLRGTPAVAARGTALSSRGLSGHAPSRSTTAVTAHRSGGAVSTSARSTRTLAEAPSAPAPDRTSLGRLSDTSARWDRAVDRAATRSPTSGGTGLRPVLAASPVFLDPDGDAHADTSADAAAPRSRQPRSATARERSRVPVADRGANRRTPVGTHQGTGGMAQRSLALDRIARNEPFARGTEAAGGRARTAWQTAQDASSRGPTLDAFVLATEPEVAQAEPVSTQPGRRKASVRAGARGPRPAKASSAASTAPAVRTANRRRPTVGPVSNTARWSPSADGTAREATERARSASWTPLTPTPVPSGPSSSITAARLTERGAPPSARAGSRAVAADSARTTLSASPVAELLALAPGAEAVDSPASTPGARRSRASAQGPRSRPVRRTASEPAVGRVTAAERRNEARAAVAATDRGRLGQPVAPDARPHAQRVDDARVFVAPDPADIADAESAATAGRAPRRSGATPGRSRKVRPGSAARAAGRSDVTVRVDGRGRAMLSPGAGSPGRSVGASGGTSARSVARVGRDSVVLSGSTADRDGWLRAIADLKGAQTTAASSRGAQPERRQRSVLPRMAGSELDLMRLLPAWFGAEQASAAVSGSEPTPTGGASRARGIARAARTGPVGARAATRSAPTSQAGGPTRPGARPATSARPDLPFAFATSADGAGTEPAARTGLGRAGASVHAVSRAPRSEAMSASTPARAGRTAEQRRGPLDQRRPSGPQDRGARGTRSSAATGFTGLEEPAHLVSAAAEGSDAPGQRIAARAEATGAGERSSGRGGRGVRTGGGLVSALARADDPEDVVRLVLERSELLSRAARDLPGEAQSLIQRIVKASADEGAAGAPAASGRGGRASEPKTLTRYRTRTVTQRVMKPAPAGRGLRAPSTGSTATSVNGVGASSVMKLAGKLMRLIHLADSERRLADAQRQVRMAEDTGAARKESGAGLSGGDNADKMTMNIKVLQQEVLDAVLVELENARSRREDPDGPSNWG